MKTFTESEMRLAQAEAWDEGRFAAFNVVRDALAIDSMKEGNPYDKPAAVDEAKETKCSTPE